MEFSSSPSTGLKRLDAQINRVLRNVDQQALNRKLRDMLARLRQVLGDAGIYVNAYELSETREEQLDNAKAASKWLSEVEKLILNLSEADIFNAIDVAHLTAQSQHIKGNLN